MHMLIFCKVHVQRNFRNKLGDHPAKDHLHQLWQATSHDEFLDMINHIISLYPDEKLERWLKHKCKDWILAGLCIGGSRIPYQWWMLAPHHTGISESSHFQDNNFTGRKLPLLAAVLKYDMAPAYGQLMLTRC